MLGASLQILFFLAFPAVANQLAARIKVCAWLGPVVLCYLAGIVLGNLPGIDVDLGAARTVTEATVVLAIPLLLMSSDIRAIRRIGGKMILGFVLAIVAVLVMSTLGAFLFAERVQDHWMIAGMLVGVYTGGTVNLNAIAVMLGVPEETVVLTNAADLLLGSVYLMFLMTLAKPLLGRLMPPFPALPEADEAPQSATGTIDEVPQLVAADILKAVALGLAAVGVAAGFSLLLRGDLHETVVILTITTVGIAASFSSRIRHIPGMYEVGQYLLLAFCVAIGAMADMAQLAAAMSTVLGYCTFVLVGAIVLHLLLAIVFRIDVDTAIITSTAAVFGPPFIGPIANVLKNRALTMPGITAGVVGLAVGNYLGYWLALLLRS